MRRVLVAGVAALLAGPVAAVVPLPASAAEGASVQATTSAMWQTNGQVDALAVAAGKVFAAGSFTSVRPPGAAPGTGEQARQYLGAFTASTGAPTAFGHTFNGAVKSLATSPDGTRLYVGGAFTTVDGAPHSRLVAFDTATSAVVTAFRASADSTVKALAVGPTGTLYLGGSFGSVDGTARTRLAAVAGDSGSLVRTWVASADALAYTLAVSGGKVFVGGAFSTLDGAAHHSVGTLDATTGAAVTFPAASTVPARTTTCDSVVKDVVVSGGTAYFGAEGTGGGCFDGTFAAKVSDGTRTWVNRCLGATQAVEVVGSWLYKGSHAHDCSANTTDPDAFPQVPITPGTWSRHLLAESLTTGNLGPWYPNTNGSPLGPHAMATDGTQLFVAGDFTAVGDRAQQGLARFSPGGDTTVPAATATPVVVTRDAGGVAVFVQAPVDPDDPDLTVRLYRDGGSTPVLTRAVHSLFWRRPVVALADPQPAGSTHTYRADVVETRGTHASALSGTASVTVGPAPGAYVRAVAADSPTLHWRFGDAYGPVAADSSPALRGGTWAGTRYTGVSGALAGTSDKAVTLDGATGVVGAAAAVPAPGAFSAEAWLRTTTTRGGKVFGFGTSPTLTSLRYDKHVYMTDAGRLVLGVYDGQAMTVTSPAAYNDGAWHHVVATQGAGGTVLYVDGAEVARSAVTTNQAYSGYWRVGGDSLAAWPSRPTSDYFAGSVDEFAVYGTALPATRVAAHWAAGR